MRFMRMLPAVGAAGVAILWAGAALAEMTGHYIGYGEGVGTTLDLQQVGADLSGRISGVVTGALLGTTDGGDNATGVVLLFGVAKLPFTGALQNGDLQLTITGVNGQQTLVPFRLDAAPVPAPARPTKPQPQPAPAPLPPVPDLATATAALRVVLDEIIADEFGNATPEVQTTLMDCLLAAVAPLSAAEIQVLVDTGFEPDDATIAQLERTAPGIKDTVTACFAAADSPPQMSVSLPNGATITVTGNGDQRFNPIEGGYRFTVGGFPVDVTTAAIIVNGGTTPLPATFTDVVITVADDDTVTATVDGVPLPLVAAPAPTPPPAPGPTPAKPGPNPAPPPPAPGPVTLDDAAVDANLRTVLAGVVAGERPDATVEGRAAIVACLMTAVAGLPTADRQHLADIGFDPDETEVARLEALLPGIAAAVGACFADPEPARTSVTLPNGAAAIIEGGTDHVFEAIEGGYRIAVDDDLDIIVTATDLTVSGTTMPLPPSFAELRVIVGEDGFTATVDGTPLVAN